MFLKIFYFVIFLSYYLIVNLKVNAFLRNDLADNYIHEHLDKVYLESDLVYVDDDFTLTKESNPSIETNIANNLLKIHKSQVLNSLGGSERLIDLMKLLESDKQEEEEDLIDEGIELKDYFDKMILSSNLDNNYYHYISEIEGGFEHFDSLGTNRLKISFTEMVKNKSLNKMNKGLKEYEFKFKVDRIIDQEHKLIRELDQKEINKYISEDFMKYSDGYYLVKKKKMKENKLSNYNYTIKIESPMEIIDFEELILFNEIKILYNQKINFKLDNNISSNKFNRKSSTSYEIKDSYEYDEDYEILEEDYNSKEEYQKVKVSKNLLARGYPVCELKCIIRDLQNRVQWTRKIGKFLSRNEKEDEDSGGKTEINLIKSYNWCDRLVFHNCIGFELESMEISILNEKLREKVHFVENILDPMLNGQIENYFNNIFTDLVVDKVLKPKQIGKIIVIDEILESNSFIISRNRNQKSGEFFNIRYEKISKFSQNLISLRQILGSTKYKLKINHLNKGFTVLSSSHKTLFKEEYPLINVIKPITKQKLVLDIEQILIFIQNILFVLKYEKANKNGIFLPWYDKSTRNGLTKQNQFINSLLSEYLTLVKLVNRQKFYSKDRFYRFNIFHIYSLISHYKSYETDSYKNKFGKMVYSSEIQVFVINTSLTYYDQARINSIFKRRINPLIKDFDIKPEISDNNILDLKYLKEYFIPIKYEIEQEDEEIINEEEDFDFGINENYFKNFKSIKNDTNNDYSIEAPKLIKKFSEIKGNMDFDQNDLVFKNNLSNFGFNIAFINYIYQNSLNLDDSIITSPPWWMVWQSQFYPRLSIEKNIREQDINLLENSEEFFREMNSTWLELPVNSENPNSFLDLGSFLPKEIISKEILESVILEEVELVNPNGLSKGDLNFSNKKDNNILEIINEKQQFYISKWKKIDVINDPNNLFFYNLFSKKQTISSNSNFNSTQFYFNPCIISIFGESNNNSEWLTNCNAKWKIYSLIFEQFTSTINNYLSISTFFALLNEIKILVLIQSQTK
ncbi:signal peptide-containing protein [Cryptosporidium hominis]